MTSHRLSTYARIALVATAAGVVTACAPTHSHYEPEPYYSPRAEYYDYWYYPAIGCYFDPRAHTYIYFEQNHWIHARTLPAHVRPYLGDHVIVRSPYDRPYEDQHRHREQYTPERYRKPDPTHRGDDIWLGAPRQQTQEHGRDDRRPGTADQPGDRDRNGKDLGREPERGPAPAAPPYRTPSHDGQRPPSAPQSRVAPVHPEPPATPAPLKQGETLRQQELRKQESPQQYPRGEKRHDATPDDNRARSRTGQPEQYRAPGQRDQRPSATPQPKVVPSPPESPAGAAPLTQQDTRHRQDNRKEDTRDQYRDGDKPPGDDRGDDAGNSQKAPPAPYDYDEGGR